MVQRDGPGRGGVETDPARARAAMPRLDRAAASPGWTFGRRIDEPALRDRMGPAFQVLACRSGHAEGMGRVERATWRGRESGAGQCVIGTAPARTARGFPAYRNSYNRLNSSIHSWSARRNAARLGCHRTSLV